MCWRSTDHTRSHSLRHNHPQAHDPDMELNTVQGCSTQRSEEIRQRPANWARILAEQMAWRPAQPHKQHTHETHTPATTPRNVRWLLLGVPCGASGAAAAVGAIVLGLFLAVSCSGARVLRTPARRMRPAAFALAALAAVCVLTSANFVYYFEGVLDCSGAASVRPVMRCPTRNGGCIGILWAVSCAVAVCVASRCVSSTRHQQHSGYVRFQRGVLLVLQQHRLLQHACVPEFVPQRAVLTFPAICIQLRRVLWRFAVAVAVGQPFAQQQRLAVPVTVAVQVL